MEDARETSTHTHSPHGPAAGIALVASGVYANPQPIKTLAENNPAVPDQPSVQYERGLIDVQVKNVPLGKVLSELTCKSGLQVYFTDPVTAKWPMSIAVKGILLVEGIKAILNGFSYAIYRVADTSGVIVLSTQPDPARTGIKTADTGLMQVSLTAAPDENSPTTQDPSASIHPLGEGVPQSLDEFQPITLEEKSSDPIAEVSQEVDPSAQLAKEQEHHEALLQRALDSLQSEYKHQHKEAINQLQGMKDPRATQALAELALNGEAKDTKARVKAVEALWQHAADLGFRDEASVNALKQLAEDSDTRVAEAARQALRSMQEYLEQNAVQ